MKTLKAKTLKVVTLEAQFPELPSPKMYQQGRGEGSNIRAAFAAAGRDLFKKVKVRRISAFTLTVSVGTRTVEKVAVDNKQS